MKLSVFTEPTNNIAPKALDKKFGFTLVSDNVTETIFLMCPVVAFPVPFFRYLL
jgi:hypothetical protein